MRLTSPKSQSTLSIVPVSLTHPKLSSHTNKNNKNKFKKKTIFYILLKILLDKIKCNYMGTFF